VEKRDANRGSAAATCKDGTSFIGAKRSGACRSHGGVQSWGGGARGGDRAGECTGRASYAAACEPARCYAARKQRSGLGQHRQPRVPMPSYSVIRQDQASHLHVRGSGRKRRGPSRTTKKPALRKSVTAANPTSTEDGPWVSAVATWLTAPAGPLLCRPAGPIACRVSEPTALPFARLLSCLFPQPAPTSSGVSKKEDDATYKRCATDYNRKG